MKKNRYPDAYRSLLRLRHSPLQAARDLYYIHVQLVEESKILHGTNYFVRFSELFTIPRVRRATLASFTVMLAQQMCGINSELIIRPIRRILVSHVTRSYCLLLIDGILRSWVHRPTGTIRIVRIRCCQFLVRIPSRLHNRYMFVPLFTLQNAIIINQSAMTVGRRTLLLFTFPQMAWTLLAAGFCFLISPDVGTARIGTIALFIFLFAAFYSPGEGPVPFCYSAEVFPLAQREQGMAFAVTTCLGWAAVLSITFPRMLLALTPTGGVYPPLFLCKPFSLNFLYV